MEREEIVKALRICLFGGESACDNCPIHKNCDTCHIDTVVADLIEQQAERIAELEAQLNRAKVSICETCKALASSENRIYGCACCIYGAAAEAALKEQEVR